jgi:3'-5' exoribonuclease
MKFDRNSATDYLGVAVMDYVPKEAIDATLDFLADDRVQTWPASLDNHHVYESGLLIHTAEVVEGALAAAKACSTVDGSVLVTAAIWHDLLKVREYELKPVGLCDPGEKVLIRVDRSASTTCWRKSDFARKIGHVTGGYSNWVHYAIQAGVDDDFRDQVSHCILAHHGRREWGSPVEPQSVEALLLHQADMLSAFCGPGRERL